MIGKVAGEFGRARHGEDRDEKRIKFPYVKDKSHATTVLEDVVPIIHEDQCISGLAGR
jgi:hypothetical protein